MPEVNIASLTGTVNPTKGINKSELEAQKAAAAAGNEEAKILGGMVAGFAALDTNNDSFLSKDELDALGKRDGTNDSISFKDIYSFGAEKKFGPEIEAVIGKLKGSQPNSTTFNFPATVVNNGDFTLKSAIGKDNNLYIYVIPNKSGAEIKKFTIPFAGSGNKLTGVQGHAITNDQTFIKLPGTNSEFLTPSSDLYNKAINLTQRDQTDMKGNMDEMAKYILKTFSVDSDGNLTIPKDFTSEIRVQNGGTIQQVEESKPSPYTQTSTVLDELK